jgi:hypothetical protein
MQVCDWNATTLVRALEGALVWALVRGRTSSACPGQLLPREHFLQRLTLQQQPKALQLRHNPGECVRRAGGAHHTRKNARHQPMHQG